MTTVRTIDVRKQRNLTPRETFNLCVKGIRHRLLRSMLTLAVVVLAVAFFMFLLSESMVLRSASRGIQEEIEQNRMASQTLTRLMVKPSDPVLVRRFSRNLRRDDTESLAEATSVAGEDWDMDRVLALARMADEEKRYTDFFAGLPVGNRLALIQKRQGRVALEYIRDHREQFREDLVPMVDVRVPGGLEALEGFLDSYDAYLEELRSFSRVWNRKVDEAVALMARHKADDRRTDAEWIATADAERVEAWRRETAGLGFRLPQDVFLTMREQLYHAQRRSTLLGELNSAEMRSEWTRAFRARQRMSAEEMLMRIDDPRVAPLFKGQYDEEDLRDLARRARYEERLRTMERRLHIDAVEEEFAGLSSRQIFLLGISFLVCMVGIANAMLMSITERFREIATMKCLGATDRYILLQFMMEAALQGIFGGVLGVLAGFGIAMFRNALVLGGYLGTYWPGFDLLLSAVFSLVTGVLLAVFASIHPSWSASRMAPMEAMRIE